MACMPMPTGGMAEIGRRHHLPQFDGCRPLRRCCEHVLRAPRHPGRIHKNSIIDFNDDFMYTSEVDSWPHDLIDAEGPQRVRHFLRQTLVDAEAAGREVTIVQTGFSGNLADLLNSDGDAVTPRNGVDLVADTVGLLSIMAGAADQEMVEFNVEKDIASARVVFSKWPTEMVVSPFELGYNILYPYSSITPRFRLGRSPPGSRGL